MHLFRETESETRKECSTRHSIYQTEVRMLPMHETQPKGHYVIWTWKWGRVCINRYRCKDIWYESYDRELKKVTYSIVKRWNGSFDFLLRREGNKTVATWFRGTWNPWNLCTENFTLLGEEVFECFSRNCTRNISYIYFVGTVNELGILCLKKWHVNCINQRFFGYVDFNSTSSDFLPLNRYCQHNRPF